MVLLPDNGYRNGLGPCPGSETLAAFIEGSLDPESHRVVVQHLSNCLHCYSVFRESVSHFLQETATPEAIDEPKLKVGSIAWINLTVSDAGGIREFYAEVLGWKPEPVDMGGYSDFSMTDPASGKPIVGICHARGGNADLPLQWLVYFVVADLNASLAECVERGGRIVIGPGEMGTGDRYCVIQDPVGAVSVLYQSAQ